MLLVLFPWSCIWPCSNTETRILCFSIFALSSSRLGIACKSNQVMVWDDSVTIKLRFSNYASATTLQQLRFSNQNSLSLQQPNLSNQDWHIKIPPPLASTCKVTSYTWHQHPTPSGKYMHSLILHVISFGFWIIVFTEHSLRILVYET